MEVVYRELRKEGENEAEVSQKLDEIHQGNNYTWRRAVSRISGKHGVGWGTSTCLPERWEK